MAKANPHWRAITEDAEGTPALAVVTGSQAYVSPSWYASKAEHGRVVPTWNYSAVHFTGRVRRHHDPAWVLDAVTRLTTLTSPGARHRGRSMTPRDVRREAAAGDRRHRADHREGRGQGQAQPEPGRRGLLRRRHRSAERGEWPGARGGRRDGRAAGRRGALTYISSWVSGSPPKSRPSSSASPEIAAICSSVSSKPKTSRFCRCRSGLLDFGIASEPICTCQRRIT